MSRDQGGLGLAHVALCKYTPGACHHVEKAYKQRNKPRNIKI